jgi:SpoVK/Ycf46/Vps4 family AAA+-type ATPase
MTNIKRSKFIQFLDNYASQESLVVGEYDVLRSSIRDNYVKLHLGNIPKIQTETAVVPTDTHIRSFYSMKPVKSVKSGTDMSDNPLTVCNYTIEKTKEQTIDIVVNNIDDLLCILNDYEYHSDTKYNIDLESLHKIKPELKLLNEMVGLRTIKQSILDQLLYFVQDLHSNAAGSDYKHTVIYGPPGTGKTEIAKIIGKMYSKIGILKKNIFKKITRNDLIAGYLGQTAIKTKQLITDSLGGVLFIDEAYSLASPEQNDSFSKECLDILCESLSDHKDDLMVIIAGYEQEMNNTFFKANRGLKSRFIWRFSIDSYTPAELMTILNYKVIEQGWSFIDNDVLNEKIFHKHKNELTNYGRDIDLLFTYIKISHGRRIYGKDPSIRKKITAPDLESGFIMLLSNRERTNNTFMSSLYV